jgi:hypothetical protein
MIPRRGAIAAVYDGLSMAVHRERGGYVVRIELSADFDEDYEGDADGYAWLEAWRARVQPRLVRAVFEQLRAEAGFVVVPASRGKSPDEELEIAVHFRPDQNTKK